jgi:hypothetical protein
MRRPTATEACRLCPRFAGLVPCRSRCKGARIAVDDVGRDDHFLRAVPFVCRLKMYMFGIRLHAVSGKVCSMASILPFIKSNDGVFEDRAMRAMGEAFDAAFKKLFSARPHQVIYNILAAKIIAAAQKRERDAVRLREAGLAWLETECQMNNATSVGDP